jgi:dethiobiotin synthetase
MSARYYITGTDTGVGKTRVTAAVAHALVSRRHAAGERGDVTIVKLVQTGVAGNDPGDAHEAGALVPCASRELHRFREPADPWNAALVEKREPLRAIEIANELDRIDGDLVIEGSGGAAVPLNADESLDDVARLARVETVLVVGLRLGCLNHAILTLTYLASGSAIVPCIALTEPWGAVDAAYRSQVERVLTAKIPHNLATARQPSASVWGKPHIVHMPFEADAARSVARAAGAMTFIR